MSRMFHRRMIRTCGVLGVIAAFGLHAAEPQPTITTIDRPPQARLALIVLSNEIEPGDHRQTQLRDEWTAQQAQHRIGPPIRLRPPPGRDAETYYRDTQDQPWLRDFLRACIASDIALDLVVIDWRQEPAATFADWRRTIEHYVRQETPFIVQVPTSWRFAPVLTSLSELPDAITTRVQEMHDSPQKAYHSSTLAPFLVDMRFFVALGLDLETEVAGIEEAQPPLVLLRSPTQFIAQLARQPQRPRFEWPGSPNLMHCLAPFLPASPEEAPHLQALLSVVRSGPATGQDARTIHAIERDVLKGLDAHHSDQPARLACASPYFLYRLRDSLPDTDTTALRIVGLTPGFVGGSLLGLYRGHQDTASDRPLITLFQDLLEATGDYAQHTNLLPPDRRQLDQVFRSHPRLAAEVGRLYAQLGRDYPDSWLRSGGWVEQEYALSEWLRAQIRAQPRDGIDVAQAIRQIVLQQPSQPPSRWPAMVGVLFALLSLGFVAWLANRWKTRRIIKQLLEGRHGFAHIRQIEVIAHHTPMSDDQQRRLLRVLRHINRRLKQNNAVLEHLGLIIDDSVIVRFPRTACLRREIAGLVLEPLGDDYQTLTIAHQPAA